MEGRLQPAQGFSPATRGGTEPALHPVKAPARRISTGSGAPAHDGFVSNDRRIDYIEFPATDMTAVKTFYAGVFGWKFTDYGPEYSTFEDGRLAGGFWTQGKPLVVIYATDLEGMESRIRAAGGTIVKEIFSFPGGRRFHFIDPSGNELAVWSDVR
jgi:predicted enzyme related to lactoylglutathione lyase